MGIRALRLVAGVAAMTASPAGASGGEAVIADAGISFPMDTPAIGANWVSGWSRWPG